MLLDLPALRNNAYDCMVRGLVHTHAVAVNAEYAVAVVAEYAADADRSGGQAGRKQTTPGRLVYTFDLSVFFTANMT